METLQIINDPNPETKDVQKLEDGLNDHNFSTGVARDEKKLALFVKNSSENIVGGLYGNTFWDWLFVKYLWVHESLRNQGYGSKLLKEAEEEAVRRNCFKVHLDTFSFQALPFYQNRGYEIFGVLEDYPKGFNRYFLQKQLQK